jgi:hypothetical protein
MFAPEPLYSSSAECIVVLFDAQKPGDVACLFRHLAAWGESAEVQYVGEGRYALIVRPGGAARAA